LIVPPTTTALAVNSPCQTIANNVLGTTVRGTCVDANGNGFSLDDPQDFFIQPMRSGPLSSIATASTDLKNQGFWLAIRVYRADALAGTRTLLKGTESLCEQGKTPFSSTGTSICPIVTMRSQIFLPTVNPKNIDDIKKGIGS
jgi:hypothetical protein